MRSLMIVGLVCGASVLALAQAVSSQWQKGTITAVTNHQTGAGERARETTQYDVTVQVDNTSYVVLFTPPNGANTVEYSRGLDLLVQVGTDTLTFNNKGTSRTTEVPILHKEVLPGSSEPDLSKMSGEYYSLKLQNLSKKLDLSEEQQKQIKPILEQETAEVGQFWDNPVISRKDKLNRWEKAAQSSDKQLKPFLSADQVQKLQEMRKEQKEKLKKLKAQPKQTTAA
jgi:hypothetical protein